jgi:hypothetical protein
LSQLVYLSLIFFITKRYNKIYNFNIIYSQRLESFLAVLSRKGKEEMEDTGVLDGGEFCIGGCCVLWENLFMVLCVG